MFSVPLLIKTGTTAKTLEAAAYITTQLFSVFDTLDAFDETLTLAYNFVNWPMQTYKTSILTRECISSICYCCHQHVLIKCCTCSSDYLHHKCTCTKPKQQSSRSIELYEELTSWVVQYFISLLENLKTYNCNAKMQYNKRKEICVVFPLKKVLNTMNIWSTQNNKELK